MKKFLKVSTLVLFFLGCGALIFCTFYMPDRTKYFFDIIFEYLNKPLPIVGISILTLGGIVLAIISRTSFGKKTLYALKNDFNELKKECVEFQNKGKDYYLLAQKKEEELIAYLSEQNIKNEYLFNEVIKVCETSPNAKIKAIGVEIKEYKEKSQLYLDEKVSEVEKDVTKYKENKLKIEELNEQVNNLELLFKELVEKYGKEESNN